MFVLRLLLATMLLWLLPNRAAAQTEAGRISIAIGTATATGNYFLTGNAICRALKRQGHYLESGDVTLVDCFAVPTTGSIQNVDLLRSRAIELALVQSDWVHNGFRGLDRFAGRPQSQLRTLLKLNLEAFQVVAGRGTRIEQWDDLKGKKVNLGPAGSTANSMFRELFKVHRTPDNWLAQGLQLAPPEQVQDLCESNIEAFGQTSGVPNPGIMDAMRRCGASLVTLETPEVKAMVAARPHYQATTIAKGTYPGQISDTATFSVLATLITTTDLPDMVAYSVVKAVLQGLPDLKSAVRVLGDVTPATMAAGQAVAPWHRGAIQAFKEAGITVNEALPMLAEDVLPPSTRSAAAVPATVASPGAAATTAETAPRAAPAAVLPAAVPASRAVAAKRVRGPNALTQKRGTSSPTSGPARFSQP
jgi:uncharacterized protein